MEHLPFEEPIVRLRNKIQELKALEKKEKVNMIEEINKLESKALQLESRIYANLDSWEKTQIARHPMRPYTLDFIAACVTDFRELHGDRHFRDDPSIVGGFGKIKNIPFMIIGTQKGRTTQENIYRNFGMPHPEGYRKALRLMKLAEKFNLPVLTLIDTAGAFPGLEAEERAQSEAIAVNLREMAALEVPIISVITGEGGSGGALALGVGNKVLMMEYSIYSVISPEGCASILFKDSSQQKRAAQSLKYTAPYLQELNIIDDIVPEPIGGAHKNPQEAMKNLQKKILSNLASLKKIKKIDYIEQRYERFRHIGASMEEN